MSLDVEALLDRATAVNGLLSRRRRAAEQWDADRAHGRAAPEREPVDARPTASEADEADAVVEALCRAYVARDEQVAAALRSAVAGLPEILRRLNDVPALAARRLAESSDPAWLLCGAAAVGLENVRVDSRDTLLGLGELWLAAESVGADPAAAFEMVAERSDEDAARLLRGFRDCAYFVADVEPRRRLK
ncbi:MAG: hypothetical protein M3N16_00500 [Actinomycetota bacterium]|nr:hypothetical protein [Actinomycetota bacterium]